MSEYPGSRWPPPLSFLSAARRRHAIGAATVTPVVIIGTLSNLHPAGRMAAGSRP
jgi:hypothetical protein